MNHKQEVLQSLVEDLQITKQKVIKKQQNINKNKAKNTIEYQKEKKEHKQQKTK
jgi:hypothetical protein